MWRLLNTNTKNPPIKNCLCQKYDIRTRLVQFADQNNSKSNYDLQLTFPDMPLLYNLQYQHCPLIKEGPK